MNPQDAESLLRYQNYAKKVLDTKSNGEEEALLEKSESYLTAAFSREIQRVQATKSCSEKEAMSQVFSSSSLKPKDMEHASVLRDLISSINSLKQSKLAEDDALAQMYPKTYMFAKVT